MAGHTACHAQPSLMVIYIPCSNTQGNSTHFIIIFHFYYLQFLIINNLSLIN